MNKKIDKTNVMRILDQKKIDYTYKIYDPNVPNTSTITNILGQDKSIVFKTLVTIGKSKEHYVFMVPTNQELDLKKAAQAAGEKAVVMILQKELLPLTGYIHGGCSPIGMKKQFKTFIHTSVKQLDTFCFSGGKLGCQIQMQYEDLLKIIPLTAMDIIKA
jgi:Cys-tRNA(Pro)/Cys-tRNA(Cys) deacylase